MGPIGRFGRFFKDARRRRVLPNALLYIFAAWVTVQVADLSIEAGVIRLALRDVFVAAFLGFPIALIVSWFYDITRKGIVRTPPIGARLSFDGSLHTRDYLLFATLAAVWAMAVVYVHTPEPIDKSIAILPFDNIGHDPNNATFAFGMRLDLQTQLQKLHDLKVIARESSDRISNDLSLREIGRKLGAAYILRGSVERVLDQVRISVVLIDAETDTQTWSTNYDRDLTARNWFDIRNEISGSITDSLQASLSPAEKQNLVTAPTENFAAHQAYLLGTQRMAKRTTASLAEAVTYFQRAVELDPDYALAWVGLADSLFLRMTYAGLPEEEEFPKVEAAINKALELDDSLGEAYVTLGTNQWQKNDWAAAVAAFERALELNPNYAHAFRWYGIVLRDLGRNEESLLQTTKALELNPLSPIINMNVGYALAGLDRFDEALVQYKKVIEIDPTFPSAYETIGNVYWERLGQLDEAVVWFRKAVASDPGQASSPRGLGFIYLDLNDSERAEFWLRRSAEVQPLFWLSNLIMEPLYMHRRDEARALQHARKNIEFEPKGFATLAHLRNDDLRAGRYAEARDRYERGYPELLQAGEPTIHGGNFIAAIDLALVLVKTGEQQRADMLLDRSLAFLPTISRLGGLGEGYGIADVLIYALQGKTEPALAALREAIDQGWRSAWWLYLEHGAGLDALHDEPEFQAMVSEIKADMAAQLEHVRAMEANGELEPIPALPEK